MMGAWLREWRNKAIAPYGPYAADIDSEETRWGALVRKLNLKVE